MDDTEVNDVSDVVEYERKLPVNFKESTLAIGFEMATRQGVPFDLLIDRLIINAAELEKATQPIEMDDGDLQLAARLMHSFARLCCRNKVKGEFIL